MKGGGALIVGFSLAGRRLAGKAQAAGSPLRRRRARPTRARSTRGSRSTPTTRRPSKTGKVEIGQGTPTGLLMIAAEELDMDMSQLERRPADTNVTPNSGCTAASNAITGGGPQVRAAAAEARQALLGLASAQLGVPASSLTVARASSRAAARPSPTAQLLGDKLFNVTMPIADAASPGAGCTGARPSQLQYKLVGTPAADRHPGQGDRHVHVRAERPRARDAARPCRSAARAGRVRAPARRSSRSTRARSSTSRARRSSATATSSASSRRTSTTRSRRRRS